MARKKSKFPNLVIDKKTGMWRYRGKRELFIANPNALIKIRCDAP